MSKLLLLLTTDNRPLTTVKRGLAEKSPLERDARRRRAGCVIQHSVVSIQNVKRHSPTLARLFGQDDTKDL